MAISLTNKIHRDLLLWARSSSYDIVVRNYFYGSWEMDVMKISSTGYVTEYEVKVSKSDFKNDFKKMRDSWVKALEGYDKEKGNKHNEIKEGKRANRFYFVVPENLVTPEDIPSHAGLIYYCNMGYMRIVKNAKLLHKETFKDYQGIATKLCFREENLRRKIREQQRILENNKIKITN